MPVHLKNPIHRSGSVNRCALVRGDATCNNGTMTGDEKMLLILFGSRATGHARAGSDWDVAVVADYQLSLEELGACGEEAARLLGANEDHIDIVDLWSASPLLQQFVAKEGKLLQGDPFLFIRFKVLAWKRYMDTAKFRRLRHESLQRYVQRTH